MEAGATSSCLPPASAVKSVTAASSESTTSKYFFDFSRIIRNFAPTIVGIFNMYRILISLIVAICSCINVIAQSPELRTSYNQVCKTLKEYKFSSEDAHEGHPEGKTTGIQFKVQNGSLVFTFNDNFGHFSDPFFGNKQGSKTITVSISNARFYMPSYGSSYMSITAKERNQVDYTYKKQKEIIDGYQLYGSEGSLKKLMSELESLLNLLREEDFNGTLTPGGQSSSKKNSPASSKNNKPTNQQSKKVGKYVQ